MEFNRLPLIVQLEIFSFLSVGEVLKIRRVCKSWANLINDEIKFKQLRCRLALLKCVKKSFNGYDFIFISTRSMLKHTSNDPKFCRIKYLKASLTLRSHSDLEGAFEFLNSYKFLEKIEFACSPAKSDQTIAETKRFVVSLNHLKEADLSWFFYRWSISVLLDLPSLHCLRLDSLRGVTIGQPEVLKTLKVNGLFEGNLDYSKFTSLEIIQTDASDLHSISARFIEELPSLKELHLDEFHCNFEKTCLGESSPSHQAGPKIFYFGFEIHLNDINLEPGHWPDWYSFAQDPTVNAAEFIARNRHKSIENNPFVKCLHYNSVASQLNDGEMFGLLPQRFSQINRLHLSGTIADVSRLLKFIGELKITELSFDRTSLPRSFFEQLTENCPFIENLEIGTELTMSILSGDFDFVFQMSKLSRIHFADSPISLNFVARMAKERRQIHSLRFSQPGEFNFWYYPVENYNWMYLSVRGSDCQRAGFWNNNTPKIMNRMTKLLNVNDGFVCHNVLHDLFHKYSDLEQLTYNIFDRILLSCPKTEAFLVITSVICFSLAYSDLINLIEF